MISLSYTVSALITDQLHTIDTLRRSILLTPLLPAAERSLVWQSTSDRIWATLLLAGVKIPKKTVAETLLSTSRRLTSTQQLIQTTKHTMDTIRHEWTGSPKRLTENTIETLALLLFPKDRLRVARAVQTKSRDIRQVLSYLDVTAEHPVIMASTLHFALVSDPVIPWGSGLLARTVCSLVLAKYGYNLRGMAGIEPAFTENQGAGYQKSIDVARREPTITSWLEYSATSLRREFQTLADTVQKLASETVTHRPESNERLFGLNDRQTAILGFLENPAATITNRLVAKRYKVSQITASRDLGKLVSLGLLYPHGKGRSVYYTRV